MKNAQQTETGADLTVAPDVSAELYENYLTGHAGDENNASLRVVLERDLLPHIPDRASSCLDLGCGQGGLTALLREKGYTGAIGVDLSPEQVQRAHDLGRDYIRQGDVVDFLGTSGQGWDVVTAFDFFEHLPREAVLPMLRSVRQSLNPGGLLIIRIPNAASPLSGRIQHGDFTHLSAFTDSSLRQLANAAGFTRTRFSECTPVVHGGKSAVRRAMWSLYSGLTRVGLAAETGRVRGHLVTSNFMAYLGV